MSAVKYTVKSFKGSYAVFQGDELITRTHSKPEAEDYVRRLSNPEENE